MTLAALVLLAAAPASSPETAVRDALRDVRRLPAQRQLQARYLTSYHVHDKKALDRLDRTLRLVTNLLSTEATLASPVRIRADLWRVQKDDYGPAWEKAWEKLVDQESFFHVKALIADLDQYETQEYGNFYLGGRAVPKGTPGAVWKTTETKKIKKVVKNKEQVASAPWLNPGEIAELIRLTGSAVPVVRADEWAWGVLAQQDRKVGYYDFTGAGKTEEEFFKAGEVNRKGAKRLKQERRTFVTRSSVVHNARELEWYQGILPLFGTDDFVRSTDAKNALRLLDGDAKPDAHEYFLRSPNGLWLWFLSNGNGDRVDFAPDNIGSNSKAPGTDKRIHIGIGCVGCHEEGLRPVKDEAILVYAPPFSLDAADPDKQRRLRDIYLRPMQKEIDRQNEDYARVLHGLTGWTTAEAAKAVRDVYYGYELNDRDLEATAREVGLTEEEWTRKLQAAARAEKKLDPVLAALHQGIPARYDQWAEVFPQAIKVAREP